MKTIDADWYEFPQYFDLAFRSETKREADFIEAACRKYGVVPVRRLLEPGCGTGRLVAALADRGFAVTGLDRSGPALAYLRRRLRRRGLQANVFQADMAAFELPEPVEAAYCLCNTIRHLVPEQSVRDHFECVARHLPRGGLYIIGLHLVPPQKDYDGYERWSERWGGTCVSVTLRELGTDWKRRVERLRMTVLVRGRGGRLRIRSDMRLRIYTAREFRQLLESLGCFELLDVYDFWYAIDEPLQLHDEMQDTVFVLRRR